MKVICINGSPETGKDKFVKLIKNNTKYRVKNISSIDRVKQIAELTMGWDGKKDPKSRLFLSEIKNSWIKFNDGPKNYVIDKINTDVNYCLKKNKKLENNIYFVHIREPEEIQKIKEFFVGSSYTLLIEKDNDIEISNDSDRFVNNYEYDYKIINNGNINDLLLKSKKFIDELYK